MKRVIVYFIEIIICFVLQSSLYQFFNLANVMPNLLLILVVSTAYMRGRVSGLVIGFFSGLLLDIMFGNLFGLYALFLMMIGYLVGYAYKIYSKDDYALPLLLIAIANFVYQFLYYIFEFLLRGKLDFLFYMRTIIIPEIIYSVAVATVMYKLLHIINNYLDRNENKED
ncbi:MAG: rod shape-determining protein MreD [Clostridiales bacterium]|nr:rod shape-determining protein MreD [Clostridiales bacterium]